MPAMPAQAILSGPDSEAVNPLPQASFRIQRTRPPFEGISDILPLFSKHTLATSRKCQGQPPLRHPITALPFAYKNKSLLFQNEIGDLLLSLFSGVVPPEVIVSPPRTVCSETFLVIGPFNNQEELMSCKKYMETDFFRVLLFFG